MVKEIIRYPDPFLKASCPEVSIDDPILGQVKEDLLDTMDHYSHCVGLAAPQIGYRHRVIAIDLTGHPKVKRPLGRMVLVNPELIGAEGRELGREGCLSVPEFTANVERYSHISLEGYELISGRDMILGSSSFEARCLQHEIDHLDGILFLDRVKSLKHDVFKRKNYQA